MYLIIVQCPVFYEFSKVWFHSIGVTESFFLSCISYCISNCLTVPWFLFAYIALYFFFPRSPGFSYPSTLIILPFSALSVLRRTVRDVQTAVLEALSNNASVIPSLQIGMVGSLVAMLQHVKVNQANSKSGSRSTRQTVSTGPRSTRQTVSTGPRSTRQTVSTGPRSTRQTVSIRPRSTRQTVNIGPRSTRQTVIRGQGQPG